VQSYPANAQKFGGQRLPKTKRVNTLPTLAGLPNTVRFNNNDIDNFNGLHKFLQSKASGTATLGKRKNIKTQHLQPEQ
jgi:hypothetical protein